METRWDVGGLGYHYEYEAQRTPWLVNATLWQEDTSNVTQGLKGSMERFRDTTHEHRSERGGSSLRMDSIRERQFN